MMQKFAIWAPLHNFVGAISSQLRHVSTIGKKLVKQQYLPHRSLQYGELRPTSGWDRFVSLGNPANFNGFRVFAALLYGTLVVGVSQSAALNRGRHLYSAGRPSRWALAHILVLNCFCRLFFIFGRPFENGSPYAIALLPCLSVCPVLSVSK